MNAPLQAAALLPPATVEFELDGQPVQALEGQTVLQAARQQGIDIPHLCFKEGLRPDGNCRACVVEIAGERTWRPAAAGRWRRA
jgi:formate dehydrogenase major subunit